jgi:hypothetical protein
MPSCFLNGKYLRHRLMLRRPKCGSHEQILELAEYHTRLETNHKNQLNCRSAVGQLEGPVCGPISYPIRWQHAGLLCLTLGFRRIGCLTG